MQDHRLETEFQFFIPLNKGLDAENLNGVASTISVDRDGERMSTNALEEMRQEIVRKGVNLFGNHEHQWENTLGVINDAQIVDSQLLIKNVKLDNPETNPKVKMLIEKMKRGINLGLSVGGTVTKERYEYDKALNRKVKIIDGVKLFEISVVGIPSNSDSFLSLPDQIAKSSKLLGRAKELKQGILFSKTGMNDQVQAWIKAGKTKDEIIHRLMEGYGKDDQEAENIYTDATMTNAMGKALELSKGLTRQERFDKEKAKNKVKIPQVYMEDVNSAQDPMAQNRPAKPVHNPVGAGVDEPKVLGKAAANNITCPKCGSDNCYVAESGNIVKVECDDCGFVEYGDKTEKGESVPKSNPAGVNADEKPKVLGKEVHMFNRPDVNLAEQYNELLDKANNIKPVQEVFSINYEKENFRQDIFIQKSKGGIQ